MSEKWGGLILLDKPAGITSFEALGTIKRRLKSRKVGHAGTLDRFARGLLLVLAGRMTRLNLLFTNLDKSYEATFRFGVQTDTLDPEGRIVAEGEVPEWGRVEAALRGFIGQIEQVPPEYSAVHTGGERAYRIARAGGSPVLASRKVTIWSMDPLDYRPPDLRVVIRCSKGTYVRALARELGLACGSCAYVTDLRRSAVGGFRAAEAVAPEEFQPERDILPAWEALERIPGLRRVILPDELVARVVRGAELEASALPALDGETRDGETRWVALFGREREAVALVVPEEGRYRYLAVLGGES